MSEGQGEDALVGQVIASQFRVLKKLGSGGMGAVFLAEQIEMDRKVVVKVLHPELTTGNNVALERFRREAKLVAQLNHPNIVQVFVFGQAESGQMYLAMEYIEGRDLAVELAAAEGSPPPPGHRPAGPMAQPRALRILDQCCAALIEAHGAGIVHRDLKPENIMLADRHGNPDYVKVLDFGIAKLHDGGGKNPTLTQAGSVFGTPRYMSPEQVKGEPVDARSDIYALGIILYEMLCGRHPFTATTTIDYLMKHVSEPVPAPSAEGLEIQPRIEALLMKALEKDPADRYQSAAEMQRDVRAALRDFSEAVRGFPSGPVPVSSGPRGAKQPAIERGTQPPGRATYHPPGSSGKKASVPVWVWALVAVLLVGGIVGIAIAVGSGNKGPGPNLAGPVPTEPRGKPGGDSPEKPDKPEPDDPDPTDKPDPDDPDKPDPDDPDPDSPRDPVDKPAGDAPTTALEAGEPLDGFPMPKAVRLQSSTTQAEVFETQLRPKEVIGFFRAKLAGKYEISEVPNGIAIAGDTSPFSYVTFSPYGDSFYMILSRNALAPPPEKPRGPPEPAFGVEFPDDATMFMRSEQAMVVRSRKPFRDVCDFFANKYGGLKGVMVMRDDESTQPTCTIAAAQNNETKWMAIAIVKDPTSAGAIMISVVPRM